MSLHRRAFLHRSVLALPALAGVGPRLLAAEPDAAEPGFPGLIVRSTEPQNLEYPFAALHDFITPNEHFYVRNHFPLPKIDLKSWRLKVEGAVERGLELSYEEVCKLPSRTVTAVLECAGNGRVFLTPTASGVQWSLGAVSNAEWTGVSLAALLEKAGVKGTAVEVILEGADRGTATNSPGPIAFARSLPIAEARRPEVLLAHRMNGKELPAAHGHPLRAVVPGWYGMASVKWLTRIIVTEERYRGFFQTLDYAYFRRRDGLPDLVPITAIEVKASIARPGREEIVPAGKPYRVFGAAWTGEGAVTKVEFSGDGGKTWQAATLLGKPVPFSWRLWEHAWQVPKQAGPLKLMARATDSKGRTQPMQRDPLRRNYMISHVVPIEVVVR